MVTLTMIIIIIHSFIHNKIHSRIGFSLQLTDTVFGIPGSSSDSSLTPAFLTPFLHSSPFFVPPRSLLIHPQLRLVIQHSSCFSESGQTAWGEGRRRSWAGRTGRGMGDPPLKRWAKTLHPSLLSLFSEKRRKEKVSYLSGDHGRKRWKTILDFSCSVMPLQQNFSLVGRLPETWQQQHGIVESYLLYSAFSGHLFQGKRNVFLRDGLVRGRKGSVEAVT